MSCFCTNNLAPKITKPNVTREKLHKTHSYEKGGCKMLMKLTPIVNFINILQTAFAPIFLRQKLQSQT